MKVVLAVPVLPSMTEASPIRNDGASGGQWPSFSTVNGTATTGDNDYVAQSGTLTFAPGETTKTITIVVQGDNKRESNEEFYVDLSGTSSNSVLDKKRGTGKILNDD